MKGHQERQRQISWFVFSGRLDAQRGGPEASVNEVEADLPGTGVFEVHGDVDQETGERRNYSAGLFRSFTDAFRADKGLGVEGRNLVLSR